MKTKNVSFTILLTAITAGAAVTKPQWHKYDADLKKVPGLVRYYTFTTDASIQPNRGGASADMRFNGANQKTPAIIEGRVTGLKAVTMDAESFRAPPLTELENDFTVSIWVKPEGGGVQLGNNNQNGMISSSGSGYYDGWRLAVYDLKTFMPTFEIGRGENSIGLRSTLPLSQGFWNHVVASWDGKTMRIFVNGVLGGMREFAGAAQPAKSDLAVGYTGFGVGSLEMAVDELAVFKRALFPSEVVALSLVRAELPDAAARAVNSFCSLIMRDKIEEAQKELRKISEGQFSERLQLWAETAAIIQKPKGAWGDGNITALCAIFENPELPAHLKGFLLNKILTACRLTSPGIPSALLERLPAEMNLNQEDKFVCATALAQSYLDEKKSENAFKVFDHLLGLSKQNSGRQREIGFKYAQALRAYARHTDAARQYLAIANNAGQPAHVRAIAALALARMRLGQRQYDEAIDFCRSICSSSTVLPHHKFEARELIKECQNLKAGQAARDPESYRSRPEALAQAGVSFFVSPKGSDENPGTIKKPFATLLRARDEIRKIKSADSGLPSGGVAVYLRGGVYKMDEPLQLTKRDSGKYGAPVVYAAWRDEKPVFDGSFEVRKFKKVRDEATLQRLPQEARGKVYVADLKARGYKALEAQQSYGYGVNNEAIRSVYADNKFMPISRWPNHSRITMVELLEDNHRAFKVDSNRLSRWSGADEIMADGFWYYLWAGQALPIESVDPENKIITLARKPGRGLKRNRPFYVMNLLEEIDQPGEWFFDSKNGRLYIWLKKHPWFTDVVVSERKRLFVEAQGVQDLVFKGITFQYGQNHAALFNNCVNLSVIGCRFHGFGGTALKVLNAANVKIYGNKLDTLGHGAMRVSGGNRRNLTPGGVHIENNEVGYFGLCSKTYVPAILLEGVGAKVRYNWFHHAPSSALRIEGNDHLIEYNLTEFVVTESDDQGGIDMWSDASYRGCVIRYNIWRDIHGGEIPCGQAGIRFDDAISGMVVYGNIFERSSNGNFGGVQIHGGHMNIIDNNVFIDCKYAVSFSPWSLERFQRFITEKISHKLHKDVNIDVPPYSDRYPTLKALRDDSKHNLNSVWRNVITGIDTPWNRPPPRTEFCDNYITKTYAPDSPEIKNSAFRPIPVSEIGPYPDPACAW